MAVELVTGYAGKAHVSSSEDGARQAGTVGTGMYALETVDEPLKATLENANTVTVGPGDVLINGRHVQLTGGTTFAVPVGTQGMQTSNLLVLRYELAEEGTESVTAITLTGEPAASDPQDPELATGSVLDGDSPVDMPLYRVVTTGIESAQPVKMFETVPPIAGLTLADLAGNIGADQLPVVPVSKGGTGATSAAAARAALGLGALATLGSPLPVANGGTGATTTSAARKALRAAAVTGAATDALITRDDGNFQYVNIQTTGSGGSYLFVVAGSYIGLWNGAKNGWEWKDDQLRTIFFSGEWKSGTVQLNKFNMLAKPYMVFAETTTGEVLVGSAIFQDEDVTSGTITLGTVAVWENLSNGASTGDVSAVVGAEIDVRGNSATLKYIARQNVSTGYCYGIGITRLWGFTSN